MRYNELRELDLTGVHELLARPYVLYGRVAYHAYDVMYIGSDTASWLLIAVFKDGKAEDVSVFTHSNPEQNVEDSHGIFQFLVERIFSDTERRDVEPIK